MNAPSEKDYLVVIQCDIARERCSGYFCEKALHERSGGFAGYPKEKSYRTLYLTCGGCCGLAVHRLLTDFVRRIKKAEGIEKDRIAVQLSSCMAKDNFHGPPCPHLEYIKGLIARIGLDIAEGTQIVEQSQQRRQAGVYDDGESR